MNLLSRSPITIILPKADMPRLSFLFLGISYLFYKLFNFFICFWKIKNDYFLKI